MKVEQIYTGCLAQGAYYIESNGEAAIIDPLRETQPYIEKAREEGAEIKFIFETHFHADFVSGHVDLAQKTGAKIIYGPTAEAEFDFHSAKDGEVFKLGEITIKALHTPGHTMESTTFLLNDPEGNAYCIFSGDTLFIGDVGRPDLAVKSDLSQEDLASLLYDSLRNKIMTLPDQVIVYPGHGAGSACGKNMSSETWDTLGKQKKTNYALREDMNKEQFIKEVTEGILPPPQYFAKNAMLNKTGYDAIDRIIKKGNVGLDLESFKELISEQETLILDTRHQDEFVKGFIPGSLFVGLDGTFAPWIGALVSNLGRPIVFLADEGREEEVVIRLARVGYDNTRGFLKGGFTTWKDAGLKVDAIKSIPPEELAQTMKAETLNILDVRKPSEYDSEHVDGALNKPLDYVIDNMHEIDKDQLYYVHCLGGYRSVIEASILKSHGYKHIINIEKGIRGIQETDIPLTDFSCQSNA